MMKKLRDVALNTLMSNNSGSGSCRCVGDQECDLCKGDVDPIEVWGSLPGSGSINSAATCRTCHTPYDGWGKCPKCDYGSGSGSGSGSGDGSGSGNGSDFTISGGGTGGIGGSSSNGRKEGSEYSWIDLDGKGYTTIHIKYTWDPDSRENCFFHFLSYAFGDSAENHYKEYVKNWRWDPNSGVYLGQAFAYTREKHGAFLISKDSIDHYIGNDNYFISAFISIRDKGTNKEATHNVVIRNGNSTTGKYNYFDPTTKEITEDSSITNFNQNVFIIPKKK